jgi:hypothetical protein
MTSFAGYQMAFALRFRFVGKKVAKFDRFLGSVSDISSS